MLPSLDGAEVRRAHGAWHSVPGAVPPMPLGMSRLRAGLHMAGKSPEKKVVFRKIRFGSHRK